MVPPAEIRPHQPRGKIQITNYVPTQLILMVAHHRSRAQGRLAKLNIKQ